MGIKINRGNNLHRPKVLLSEDEIRGRVERMGAQITEEYRGRDLTLITVLKGSVIFAADLCRFIDLPLSMDFLGLRSYGDGTESSGVVQITSDLTKPIEDKHVIVVEDIVDTGATMEYLFQSLETRKPASVKLASLLHKPARTTIPVDIDYLGFTIDDVFVVGYGLDYAQKFRNLPYIGVLEP